MPLILLSPTKTLDFSGERSLQHQPPRTAPVFQEVASALASHMATFTRAQLAKLLGISDDLAATNTKRFAAFAAEPEPDAVEYGEIPRINTPTPTTTTHPPRPRPHALA